MRVISLATVSFLATVLLGQNAPPAAAPKPAAAKPAAAGPKAAAASPVDSVIQSVKAGLSEGLIIRTLQRENKPANLAPADLVKLKNAGVSENMIGVMIDPASAPAQAAASALAPATVAAPAPSPAPTPSLVPVSLSAAVTAPAPTAASLQAQKKRV